MPSRNIPRVSVLLPVYNSERYLREAINSVLAQRSMDFELIVWDDGSTDGTADILAAYRDARLRVFRGVSNRGLFPALNAAAAEARGDLLRLWAHDDRMKPHCLEREADFWDAHPDLGMSYCQWDEIDAEGRLVATAPPDDTPEVMEPWLAAQISFYFGCMPGNISTVTMRNDVFKSVGGFAGMRLAGDFDLWERISARHPIGFVRESLIELRSHAGQLSRQPEERLDFVREDRVVISRLFERLPPALRRHARSYHRRRRGTKLVHGVFAALAAGRLRTAREFLTELRREGNPLVLLLLWLATANGRWFRPRPKYLEPPRLEGSSSLPSSAHVSEAHA